MPVGSRRAARVVAAAAAAAAATGSETMCGRVQNQSILDRLWGARISQNVLSEVCDRAPPMSLVAVCRADRAHVARARARVFRASSHAAVLRAAVPLCARVWLREGRYERVC